MKKTLKQKIFGYNGFFRENTPQEFKKHWESIEQILAALNIPEQKVLKYKEAYVWFINNPDKFDGATFVKDLFVLKLNKRDQFGKRIKLDINAMLHDYEYFMGAYYSFREITKSNYEYVKNIQSCGQGLHYTRFIGLTFISLFYVPFRYLQKTIRDL